MNQNKGLGKKKQGARILSFVVALVLVFSIFSGMVSAECVLTSEEVLSEEWVPTSDLVIEKQWVITDITCEEAKWEGTIIATTEGYSERTVKRTYECCCENTGKCEVKDETVTEKIPCMECGKETKTVTTTTGATCPQPCATNEEIAAVELTLIAAGDPYAQAEDAYGSALSAYNSNEQAIANLESQIEAYKEAKRQLEDEEKSIQDIINDREQMLEAARVFCSVGIDVYCDVVIDLEAELEDMREELFGIQSTISTLECAINNVESDLETLRGNRNGLQNNLDDADRNLKSARINLDVAQQEVSRLKGLPYCNPVPVEHPDCAHDNLDASSLARNNSPYTFYTRAPGNLNYPQSLVKSELNDDLSSTEVPGTEINRSIPSPYQGPIGSIAVEQDRHDVIRQLSNTVDKNDTLAVLQSDAFTGVFSDYGTDANGDGLYDYLTIDVGVSVTTVGDYLCAGVLYDADGIEIGCAVNNTYLDGGDQAIKLNFDGKEIQAHGVNGPYYLKDLALADENGALVGYIVDAYTTTAYDYTEFQALIPPAAQFIGDYSDYGLDIDGDGLYDYLVIESEVNVIIAGNYIVSGSLYDVNGNEIAWAHNDTYLPIGDQTAKLYFDGELIRTHGVNGPYYLKNIMLSDESYKLRGCIVEAYTTSAYVYTDFQIPVQPTHISGEYSDYGMDIDGNGLYDYLTVDVGVNVTDAGNYTVSGSLYDVNGNEIVWAHNDTYLPVGEDQAVKLYFDGKKIRIHGVDGPYSLKNVVLMYERTELLQTVADAYTTSAYSYTDFQSPLLAEFTDTFTDCGTDLDGNGLYDYLTVDVGVNAADAGNYFVSGSLCDVNGLEIVWSSNNTDLPVGTRTLKLNFDGKTIRKHGVNGPYHLKNLTLFNENQELTDLIVDAYTTSAYDYAEFQIPPAAAFTGIYSDYGRDINSDGLYEYLTIDVGVDATVAGNYSIEGWLYDVNGTAIVWAGDTTYLTVGIQTVELNFDGENIREHGVNGPYNLKNLVLFDENSIVLAYIVDAYTSSAYDYTDFQISSQFTDTYFDYGKDIDDDGLYDYLTVDVGVMVTSAGNYSVGGLLLDPNESIVVSTRNDTYLDIGVQSVLLNFDGVKIRRHGVNAFFNLSHLTLFDENGNLLDCRYFAYTTSVYNYSDFKLGAFCGCCSDYGIDFYNDGLYDYLTIDICVNVTTPGNYTVSGYLYDVNGDEIVWAINYDWLDIGQHIMHLDFNGKTIQLHGVDGPYYLKYLTLSGKNWTVIDYLPDACNTSTYNSSDFVDPVSTENEVIISGVGKGEISLIVSFTDKIPTFFGRYSYDLIGINIPQKPNTFTITSSDVKNLKVGVKKIQDSKIRTWITQTVAASEGIATVQSDLPSPGNYHVKIFGDAADGASEVGLELTATKMIPVNGTFSLSVDISGFPTGKYSVRAEADTGYFTDLMLDGLPLAP